MTWGGRWFSPGTPVSSSNKTDRHDITQILLKVALNTINQPIKKTGHKTFVVLHELWEEVMLETSYGKLSC